MKFFFAPPLTILEKSFDTIRCIQETFYIYFYMARYTCSFAVTASSSHLPESLIEILESCNFDIMHVTGDFLMARERPGQVSFAKLVSVEVLIDKVISNPNEQRMHFVVKNEELPLQRDNHCKQLFDLLLQSLIQHDQWHLLESVES